MKISDREIGDGPICVPGDVAVCRFTCRLRKGDILFASDPMKVRKRGLLLFSVWYGLVGTRKLLQYWQVGDALYFSNSANHQNVAALFGI